MVLARHATRTWAVLRHIICSPRPLTFGWPHRSSRGVTPVGVVPALRRPLLAVLRVGAHLPLPPPLPEHTPMLASWPRVWP